MADDCIFCKIVKGDIPSCKLYEDDKVISFLDIGPANKGHALVISKMHHELLTDTPSELLQKMIIVVQKVAAAVVKATNADGFNVLNNNKKAAGQLVPHVHFHIVPRFADDGLKLVWPNKEYEEKEIEEYMDKIKSVL